MSDVVRNGVHLPLENEADRLIKESLRGVTSQGEKSDILTPWKMHDRLSREVFNVNGTAEPHTRRGMYHRVANTTRMHLNSRECISPPQKLRNSPIGSMSTPQDTYYDGSGEW